MSDVQMRYMAEQAVIAHGGTITKGKKMSKLYIGISGKMGSGKTTLTNNLIKALDSFTCERVSMAKPIYDIQDKIYEMIGAEVDGDKDRPLLIALGMWGRDKDTNFWLDQATHKMGLSIADIVICDDVRFENEADWFKDNGLLLRIEGEQRGDNVDDSRKDNITETALDNYKFENIISNKLRPQDSALIALRLIGQLANEVLIKEA